MEMKLQKLNEFGLLDGVSYEFNDDGSINWRAMIDPKYLYVNAENFQRRGEKAPSSVEGLADKDLIIMLGGLKELASLRKYTSVSYRPIVASNEYAAVVCKIRWVGNFETDMQPVWFEDCAGANLYNVGELVQSYLLEMATNRAFARCIRNFLKINIVSKEELPPSKRKPTQNGLPNVAPAQILAKLMKEKGRTFKDVKEKLVAEGNRGFEDYSDWADIPGDLAFQLVNRFKNLKEVYK